MSISEHITPFHLGRKALIYIRQSSPHQALTNQESQHLQYALRQRAGECGWAAEAIEVIDTELDAVQRWTAGGRTPSDDERKGLDMGLRVVRELEPITDPVMHAWAQKLYAIESYMEDWPDDATAASATDDDWWDKEEDDD